MRSRLKRCSKGVKKLNEISIGLSGYLAPDGQWFPCGYLEHSEKACKLVEKYHLDTSDSNLIAMGGDFIKFGTAPWATMEGSNMCHVFMNIDQELTKNQIEWLEVNLIHATQKQQREVLLNFSLHYKTKLKFES